MLRVFHRSRVLALALLIAVVALPGPTAAQDVNGGLPAFPGAEGFGAMASGGRGGAVYIVSTLEPFGPGSLGDALAPEVCEPRIVVFQVSGVIEAEFDVTCGDLTIAGQTAPGAGITIRGRLDGYGASPGGNIIIRHIRVRPGEAQPDKAGFHDAIQLSNNVLVILDHVSASWSTDEVIDFFEGASDITVQWSTIEASRLEGHPEGQHNYGLIVGPEVPRVTIHHTLFAHQRSRCPAVSAGPAEIINNVVYNCRDGFVHHNPAEGEFHIIGNTYRSGPDVGEMTPIFFDDEEPGGTRYYVAGNFIDDPGVFVGAVEDIWAEPFVHPGLEYAGGSDYAISDPDDFSGASTGHVPVTIQNAEDAYEAVLDRAGAFPRDGVTARTVVEVRERSGSWGAAEPTDLLGDLVVQDAPIDADRDGMADDWESANGLDAGNGDDHDAVMPSGYTAIEEYVNALADQLVADAPSATRAVGPVASASPDTEYAQPSATSTESPATSTESSSGSNTLATALASAALALAVVAVAVSILALVRVSRTVATEKKSTP